MTLFKFSIRGGSRLTEFVKHQDVHNKFSELYNIMVPLTPFVCKGLFIMKKSYHTSLLLVYTFRR